MTKLYTEDYGSTVDELDDKYNSEGDGEHPGYTRRDWRHAVNQEDTISGYWAWLRHKLFEEQDELGDRDPYPVNEL